MVWFPLVWVFKCRKHTEFVVATCTMVCFLCSVGPQSRTFNETVVATFTMVWFLPNVSFNAANNIKSAGAALTTV